MALIKCPECGGEVSSNADTCVHCGCKYSYCPECGTVHLGALQTCPACGYKIDKAVSAGTVSGGNSGDFTGAYSRRAASDKVVDRAFKITTVLSIVAMIAFMIIAAVVVLKCDKNSLNGLLRANEAIKQSHGLIITGCVFFAISAISGSLRELYFQVFFAKWLCKYKIDAVSYLKKDDARIKASFTPEEGSFSDVSTPAYLTVVPHDAGIKIFKAAARSLLAIGCGVALGYFLAQNLDALIYSELYNQSFEFAYIPLIAAAVLMAAQLLVNYVCEAIFSKRRDEWLKSVNLL